jgi:hypothetical protein
MNFTVDWLPAAEQELASIWMGASNRKAVTRAAYVIDQRLGTDPENEGESRPKNRRILFCKPLGVLFRVLIDEKLVEVLHVWSFK